MLSVKLICVGKMKEKYYISAFEEYAKRLRAFCRFELAEIPEDPGSSSDSEKEAEAALSREAEAVERQIPKGSRVVAMCSEGEKMSSTRFAGFFEKEACSGFSKFCFIIGGSEGLSDCIKKSADLRLSMSDMTFPHHLARVMLAEQIYRALSINAGSRYHK